IHDMPVTHEDVSVRSDDDVGGTIECIRALCGNASLPEGHENLAILIQFKNLLTFTVFVLPISDPDIPFAIDRHSMSLNKREVVETLQELPGWRKFQNHRIRSVKNPDVTLRIDIDGDDRAQLDVCGKLSPTLGKTVRISLRERGCSEDEHCRNRYCETRC